jgi:hypothetical protein
MEAKTGTCNILDEMGDCESHTELLRFKWDYPRKVDKAEWGMQGYEGIHTKKEGQHNMGFQHLMGVNDLSK